MFLQIIKQCNNYITIIITKLFNRANLNANHEINCLLIRLYIYYTTSRYSCRCSLTNSICFKNKTSSLLYFNTLTIIKTHYSIIIKSCIKSLNPFGKYRSIKYYPVFSLNSLITIKILKNITQDTILPLIIIDLPVTK